MGGGGAGAGTHIETDVEMNVGKTFFKLLQKHFPPTQPCTL